MKINYNNWRINKVIHKLWIHFCSDSLFRNSIYLMLSTGIQAVFGFVFWLICARLYTPEEIGLGSTLISAAIFISYASLLGFNDTLIKFLPLSKQRNETINSALILVLGMALLISFAYVISLPHLAPKLEFVTKNYAFFLAFILLSAFSAVNLLTDSIFIAYRASKYNLIIYTIQSMVKLIFPVALVMFSAFGVFASFGLSTFLALILSLYFLTKKFECIFKISIRKNVLKTLWKFSSANYISNLFNIVPIIVIPIIIINKLGAAQAGYYYLAFMVASLLYAVAYSVSRSLFAEGSHDEVLLRKLFKRAGIILAAIMIPAGIALAFIGPFLLQIFGKTYGEEASQVIVLLSLSAPAVAASALSSVVLRVKNKIFGLVMANIVYAITISGLAYIWADRGLSWIAIAWLVGNLASVLVSFIFIFNARRRNNIHTVA